MATFPWFKQKGDYYNNQEKGNQQSCNLNIKNESVQAETCEKGNNGFYSRTYVETPKIDRGFQWFHHNVNHIQRNTSGCANSNNNQQGNLSWILDIGATDHVTFQKNLFVTYYKIKPVHVKFPNESFVTAEYSGTIQLSKDFIISNVLYIPNFSFNLIFV